MEDTQLILFIYWKIMYVYVIYNKVTKCVYIIICDLWCMQVLRKGCQGHMYVCVCVHAFMCIHVEARE